MSDQALSNLFAPATAKGNAGEQPAAPVKPKRTRRTQAQIAAATLAEAPEKPKRKRKARVSSADNDFAVLTICLRALESVRPARRQRIVQTIVEMFS